MRAPKQLSWAGLVFATAAIAALSGGCPPSAPVPPATTVALQLVASGLTSPLGMAVPNDGSARLFIVDQIGTIRIIDSGGALLPTPFLDLADRMVTVGIDLGDGLIYDERGALGLAFHPHYAENGRFYVFYTAPKGADQPAGFDSETHVSEFRVSPDDSDRADPESERVLLRIGKPQFNHNGGQLAFGPDGYLYISVGDGGASNDVGDGHTPDLGNGQDKSKLLGKILRIDVDQGDPYAVPDDNPFVGEAGAQPELWAYGFRNPWRFSFDTGGAHQLYCADVGQDVYEEVNIVVKGGNYGWHIREGLHCFDPNDTIHPPEHCATVGADGQPLIDPILEYPHVDMTEDTSADTTSKRFHRAHTEGPSAGPGTPIGISVIGGFIYHGQAIPGLRGNYVFGDFSTQFDNSDGSLFAAEQSSDGTWTRRELTITGTPNERIGRYLLGVGQDAAGELYLLTTANLAPAGTTGEVYRIVPGP